MTVPAAPVLSARQDGVGVIRVTAAKDTSVTSRRLYRGPSTLAAITGVALTDLFTKNGHGLLAGDIVIFDAGITYASAPASPIAEGTIHYVIATGLTANAFEVSLTPGGAAIDFDQNVTAAAAHTWVFRQTSALDIMRDVVTPGTTYVYTAVANSAGGWSLLATQVSKHAANYTPGDPAPTAALRINRAL